MLYNDYRKRLHQHYQQRLRDRALASEEALQTMCNDSPEFYALYVSLTKAQLDLAVAKRAMLQNMAQRNIKAQPVTVPDDPHLRLAAGMLSCPAEKVVYLAYISARDSMTTSSQLYENFVSNMSSTFAFSTPFECDICQDQGVLDGKDCVCFTRTLSHMLSRDGIDFATYDLHSDSYKSIKVADIDKIYSTLIKWTAKYPDTPYVNVNLLGSTGTGKTYLMKSVGSEMLKSNKSVMFVTAFTLNEHFRKYHCSQPNDLSAYTDCDVLAIDDLGTEPVLKNVTVEYLYNLLNERMTQYRATIISSNLDLSAIMTRYGSRIYSRLASKTTALNLHFAGNDARTKLN